MIVEAIYQGFGQLDLSQMGTYFGPGEAFLSLAFIFSYLLLRLFARFWTRAKVEASGLPDSSPLLVLVMS